MMDADSIAELEAPPCALPWPGDGRFGARPACDAAVRTLVDRYRTDVLLPGDRLAAAAEGRARLAAAATAATAAAAGPTWDECEAAGAALVRPKRAAGGRGDAAVRGAGWPAGSEWRARAVVVQEVRLASARADPQWPAGESKRARDAAVAWPPLQVSLRAGDESLITPEALHAAVPGQAARDQRHARSGWVQGHMTFTVQPGAPYRAPREGLPLRDRTFPYREDAIVRQLAHHRGGRIADGLLLVRSPPESWADPLPPAGPPDAWVLMPLDHALAGFMAGDPAARRHMSAVRLRWPGGERALAIRVPASAAHTAARAVAAADPGGPVSRDAQAALVAPAALKWPRSDVPLRLRLEWTVVNALLPPPDAQLGTYPSMNRDQMLPVCRLLGVAPPADASADSAADRRASPGGSRSKRQR